MGLKTKVDKNTNEIKKANKKLTLLNNFARPLRELNVVGWIIYDLQNIARTIR